MRIGVFGGSFNPVHLGHLIIAQDALEQFELDRVLFVPAARPPHKPPDDLAEAEHRLAMLRLALENNPEFEVSDLEIARGGVSYTLDTVRALQNQNPEAELYFIIGSDSLVELHTWKEIDTLLGLCRFITFARPDFEVGRLHPEDLRLPRPAAEALLAGVLAEHRVGLSSSEIRMRVAEGMRIRYLVLPEVEMYIAEHGLYL